MNQFRFGETKRLEVERKIFSRISRRLDLANIFDSWIISVGKFRELP